MPKEEWIEQLFIGGAKSFAYKANRVYRVQAKGHHA